MRARQEREHGPEWEWAEMVLGSGCSAVRIQVVDAAGFAHTTRVGRNTLLDICTRWAISRPPTIESFVLWLGAGYDVNTYKAGLRGTSSAPAWCGGSSYDAAHLVQVYYQAPPAYPA